MAGSLQQGIPILSETVTAAKGDIQYYTMTLPDGYNIIEFNWTTGSGTWEIRWSKTGYDTTSPTVSVGYAGTRRVFGTPGLYYVTVVPKTNLTNFSFSLNAYYWIKAQVTSPTNDSTLTSTSLPLVWNQGIGATGYYLFVGRTPGGYDIYAGSQGTSTSRQVTVPAGIGRIHVTLWSLINGSYFANYYVYETTPAVKATLTSPADGSTLTSGVMNLVWSPGVGVSRYYGWVGSSLGGYDIAAFDAGTSTSRSVTVPTRGGPVFVRLYSLINGAFQWNDYWFTTALAGTGARPARITSPAQGSALASQTVPFTWDIGVSVSAYALWVGSAPGGYDLYAGYEGTATSRTVTVPGDGRKLYVTLYSLINGAYQANSYWYTCPTLPDGGAAQITTPTPGSTLAGTSLALSWGAVAGATNYYLFVGSTQGSYDLYAASEGTSTTRTVTVPNDGRPIYATLYSLVRGAYISSNARFTAANTASGSKRALVISPAVGTTLPNSSPTITWGGGSGVTTYVLWVGSTPGGYDLWASPEGLNTSRVVSLPADGRKIYVTLYSLISGAWQAASYVYTAANLPPTKGVITAPTASGIFSGTSETFTWTNGSGPTAFALWLGHTPGGYDIYAGYEGINTTRAVTTLPLDGSPVYATLWSLINGAWQSSEVIYQANVP